MISIGPELGQHLMRPWKIRSVLAPDGQYPAESRYRCRTTPQRNLLVKLKCRSRGLILERAGTLIVRGLCALLLRIKFEPALLAEVVGSPTTCAVKFSTYFDFFDLSPIATTSRAAFFRFMSR